MVVKRFYSFFSNSEQRFLFLLVSILILLFLSPLLEGFLRIKILIDIFSSMTFIIGAYAISQKKRGLIDEYFLKSVLHV